MAQEICPICRSGIRQDSDHCTVCGYEYEGEELPADFICPVCKHPASDFEKVIV